MHISMWVKWALIAIKMYKSGLHTSCNFLYILWLHACTKNVCCVKSKSYSFLSQMLKFLYKFFKIIRAFMLEQQRDILWCILFQQFQQSLFIQLMITSDVHINKNFLNFLKNFTRQQQIVKIFPTFFLYSLLLTLYNINIAGVYNHNFTFTIIIFGWLWKFLCIKLPILIREKILWANHKNLHNILIPNFLSCFIQFHVLTNKSVLHIIYDKK